MSVQYAGNYGHADEVGVSWGAGQGWSWEVGLPQILLWMQHQAPAD